MHSAMPQLVHKVYMYINIHHRQALVHTAEWIRARQIEQLRPRFDPIAQDSTGVLLTGEYSALDTELLRSIKSYFQDEFLGAYTEINL